MKMLLRRKCGALFGAVLLFMALCAGAAEAADKNRAAGQAAADPVVRGAKVLAVGVFASTLVSRSRSLAVADGIRDEARDFRLLRRGSVVDAELGESIGLRYQINGEPKGAKVLVDVVVRHPAMVNPDTQLPMTVSTARYERAIGAAEHGVWSFDTPGSLVPGEYVIEILHGGRSLARQAFQVRVKK